MKRIALLISALLVVGIASAQRIEKESSSVTLHKIDRQAEHMKRKILSSKTEVKPAGTIYYVSAEGDDANDGLSPEKPLRTLEKVNALELRPADGVMFRRGDMWRGYVNTREVFESYRDLKRDLDMYHDYRGTRRLYLCSTEGNPAERFASIELLPRSNIFRVVDDVTIDNICLKYCGAHAIGAGTTKGLTVTNCELGWIGGSIQFEHAEGIPTRYGNAIEIYGGCEDFTIDNCYVYQVYDAALTHQHQGNTQQLLTMKNVRYTRCLVEDCVYAIEYFLGREDTLKEHYMLNILFENNILRRAGMGWGSQRPDKITPAIIKSWSHHNNRAFNYVIRGNIFDRSTYDLLNIAYRDPYSAPVMEGNTYIQYLGADGGHLGQDRKFYHFDGSFPAVMERIFGERKGKYIFIER